MWMPGADIEQENGIKFIYKIVHQTWKNPEQQRV